MDGALDLLRVVRDGRRRTKGYFRDEPPALQRSRAIGGCICEGRTADGA